MSVRLFARFSSAAFERPIVMTRSFRWPAVVSGLLLMLAGCAGEPARHANLADTVQGVAPSAWSVAAPQ